MARALHKLSDARRRRTSRAATATAAGSISTSPRPARSPGCSCGRRRRQTARNGPRRLSGRRLPRRGRRRPSAALSIGTVETQSLRKKREAEPTFGECADLYIASIKSEWRNAKHAAQWKTTLSDILPAYPAQAGLADHDRRCARGPHADLAEPRAKRPRASGRIERVLDFAKVKGGAR